MSNAIKEYIRKDFKKIQDKKRNFNGIRRFFDLFEGDEYTLDDQTWEDLMMDDVFSEIDRTYSSAGESAMYNLLRNPIMNEEKLKKRDLLIKNLEKNLDLTTEIRMILFNMGFDKKNRLIEMLEGKLPVNKAKYFIYTFTGKILPFSFVLLAIILSQPFFMILLMFSISLNIGINQYESKNISAVGLIYLRDLIDAGKKIANIKDPILSEYSKKIKNILEDIDNIAKGTTVIKLLNLFSGLFEAISIPFLLEETSFYNISKDLNEKEEKILELYYLVGEIDAYVSVASYKACNKDIISTPIFIKDMELNIEKGIHPLIKKPVANSINIKNKGIVLTGTNMSGKSTFLRMVSTNILLAQSFNFVLAKKYKGCFFNIVSSISPKDDITKGKSYYLSEAESILRIIKALDKEVPIFCPIDEIFRGTNPIERISSSAEILDYINKRNAICIVATHDRELTDMLKEKYNFYYFSEDVNNEKGLSFDYKLKEGISKTRNAIKLLDYIGYPEEIIQNAYKRSESLEKYL